MVRTCDFSGILGIVMIHIYLCCPSNDIKVIKNQLSSNPRHCKFLVTDKDLKEELELDTAVGSILNKTIFSDLSVA